MPDVRMEGGRAGKLREQVDATQTRVPRLVRRIDDLESAIEGTRARADATERAVQSARGKATGFGEQIIGPPTETVHDIRHVSGCPDRQR